MEYKALPFSSVWSDGIFNLPTRIADEYLKLASEYQLKALIYIFRHNGTADTAQIAKALGQTLSDTDSILEFWVEEGILSADGKTTEFSAPKVTQPVKETIVVKHTISAPILSPQDIITMLKDDEKLRILVNEAQNVLARTISTAEQATIINMVNYYELKPEIVLMILEYYRAEKQKGNSISFSYINSMAKNWSDEGIDTIEQAEQKLKDIESSSRLWKEVVAITGIKHRNPTAKQREMVKSWFADFDITMITIAADIMKENIAAPNLKYINTILNKWKKAGIKTPEDVEKERLQFNQSKTAKESTNKNGKLKSKPSYDLQQIKLDAMNNTDI